MDFYWSFLLMSAGEGGLLLPGLWLSPGHVLMFVWEGNPCCPALAGVGVTNVTMICWLWGLITVNGGSEPEKGCQRDVHMLLCDMWHSVMRAQGQGQGHIIQQPFTVMSAGRCCCAAQIRADVCWKAWEWGEGGLSVTQAHGVRSVFAYWLSSSKICV